MWRRKFLSGLLCGPAPKSSGVLRMQELILYPFAIPRWRGPNFAAGDQHPYTKRSEQSICHQTRMEQIGTFCLFTYYWLTHSSTVLTMKHLSVFSNLYLIPPRSGHLVTNNALRTREFQVSESRPDPPHPKPPSPQPQMAHLFQANMPPMVEAKMIARITQQIMIMIFFCSSRQGKKKHMRNSSAVQSSKERTHKRGSGRGRGYEGNGDGSGFRNPEC